MSTRFKMLREVFLRPAWGIALIVLGFFGHLETIISWAGAFLQKDLSYFKDIVVNSAFFGFISTYWWELFLWAAILAISEKFFQIARPFLGECVKVNMDISPSESKSNKHIGLVVINHEKYDIERCYATLDQLLFNDQDVTSEVNQRFSLLEWRASQSDHTTIKKNDGEAEIDIAKYFNPWVVFRFHPWETCRKQQGEYFIRVFVDGDANGVQIERIKFEGRFRFQRYWRDMSKKAGSVVRNNWHEIPDGTPEFRSGLVIKSLEKEDNEGWIKIELEFLKEPDEKENAG